MSRTVACGAACVAGSCLVLSYVLWFGVNVPVNDDWDHVETTLRWLANGIDLKTVFAAYNEHCIAFTRLFTHGLLTASGGNYRTVLVANALLMVATLAVLLAFVRRWPLPTWCMAVFAAALAAIVTAWCQWQILLWACTTPWFVLPLVLVTAATIVARARSPWAAVFAAGAAAAAGVVCNSNGLFLGWALVPAVVLRLRGEPQPAARRAAIVFGACLLASTAFGAAFIMGGRGPGGGGLAAVLASPLEAARCVLAVLGSPLDPVGAFHGRQTWSAVAGGLSLAAGVAAIVGCVRQKTTIPSKDLGLGFALMIYGLASVAAVVLGRLALISTNPVESRYQTFAIAWHVGVLVSCAFLAAGAVSRWRTAWQAVLVSASAACIVTTVLAAPLFIVHGRNMKQALAAHQTIYKNARSPEGREPLEKISRHYGADRLLRNLEGMKRAGILHPDLSTPTDER